MRAMQAMEQANEADILTSVISLEAAATTMEGIVCSLPNVLRDRAAELVRACVELKRAHNAMATVQQAAAKQREARIAGAVGVAAASEPGQGDDKRVGMMGYGLFGSIGLIPYLGPDKVAKRIELLTDNWKLAIQIVVCVWWTAVALGAPCSAYAQSIYEQAYALFSSRLGILGMNAVVILFMYCVLDIDNIVALCCLLGIAIFLHALFFILTWCRGHF